MALLVATVMGVLMGAHHGGSVEAGGGGPPEALPPHALGGRLTVNILYWSAVIYVYFLAQYPNSNFHFFSIQTFSIFDFNRIH